MIYWIRCNNSSHIMDCSNTVEYLLGLRKDSVLMRYAIDLFGRQSWQAMVCCVNSVGVYESKKQQIWRPFRTRNAKLSVKMVACDHGYMIEMSTT